MAYQMKKAGVFDSTAELALTSNAVIKKFCVSRPMVVTQAQIHVSTAINSTGSVVVAIKKYVTTNSASGEVAIDTITIPTGVAAGKVYYVDITPTKIVPGDELVFEVTTAASSAGKGICAFDAYDEPEMPDNNSDMVESA